MATGAIARNGSDTEPVAGLSKYNAHFFFLWVHKGSNPPLRQRPA